MVIPLSYKQEPERKSKQLNISVSPYLDEKLEELVKIGLFSSKSDAVRWAIAKMIADFEVKGVLKSPKTSKENPNLTVKEDIEIR